MISYDLSNSDLLRPVNKTHIDVLQQEFKEKPASNFTVMVVNIPHFKPKDRHITDVTSGDYKFEVLGRNHTRLTFQSLEEVNPSSYASQLLPPLCWPK